MPRDGRYVAMSQGWRYDECPGMDSIPQKGRMAVRLCLLFFPVFFSALPAAADSNCLNDQHGKPYDEVSKIRYIHDGDTLHLSDGRKVRLIGINTPELARDGKPAEPFAMEAKNTLKSLFKDEKSIALLYGKDKKDHYGRILAHALLNDGQNVQAILLKQGYARVITVPPNTQFVSCYLEIEREARCNKTGLWRNADLLVAKDLQNHHKGFQLIQGTVEHININKKGLWLTLDNKLTIGIRPEDQFLFDTEAINNMLNQSIIVRGWVNKSKKPTPFYIRVRHPLSIQLSSAFSCD
jgi:endonuclease YncB( thermonuclease family)